MGSFRSVIFESAGYLLLGGIELLAVNVMSFGLVYWWIEGGKDPRSRLGYHLGFPRLHLSGLHE